MTELKDMHWVDCYYRRGPERGGEAPEASRERAPSWRQNGDFCRLPGRPGREPPGLLPCSLPLARRPELRARLPMAGRLGAGTFHPLSTPRSYISPGWRQKGLMINKAQRLHADSSRSHSGGKGPPLPPPSFLSRAWGARTATSLARVNGRLAARLSQGQAG